MDERECKQGRKKGRSVVHLCITFCCSYAICIVQKQQRLLLDLCAHSNLQGCLCHIALRQGMQMCLRHKNINLQDSADMVYNGTALFVGVDLLVRP